MAAGDTILDLSASDFTPTDSAGATVDRVNEHDVLAFNDTTAQKATSKDIVVPEHYDDGGFTVDYHIAMASATTGDVDIDGNFEKIDVGDPIISDNFAGVQSADAQSVVGTAGDVFVFSKDFTHAQADSPVPGRILRFQVTRDAGNDSASGDMQLLAVHIKEKT